MRILTCSNSCPQWEGGVLRPRSPGGLVPMLVDVLNVHGGDWIFTAPPGGAGGTSLVELDGGVRLHPIDLDERTRSQHYNEITLGLFLGLVHYLHDASVAPLFDASMRDAWAGYESANRTYAKKLAELVPDAGDTAILVNDPHLMLVPEMLDEHVSGRGGPLAYFLGTPWCEPEYYGLLPESVRDRILASLLRCDTVGFHSERWVRAFAACCERYLPGVEVDGSRVRYRDHVTTLIAAPFPLDVDTLDEMRDEPATRRWREWFDESSGGRRILLRAERLDLWKNALRGLLAYEAALDAEPELAASCWYAALLTTPSRATARHQEYRARVEEVVDRINERFGTADRPAVTVIHPEHEGSRNCVVAGLGAARAAIVDSTWDGLNLFAKEAAYLLGDGTTLLLSRNAGAHDELDGLVTTVDPFDVARTGRAIQEALSGEAVGTPAGPRRERMRAVTLAGWLEQVFLQ